MQVGVLVLGGRGNFLLEIFFRYSFNTQISSTVCRRTHFKYSLSTHTFQVQFQHTNLKYTFHRTHFKYSFHSHISSQNFQKNKIKTGSLFHLNLNRIPQTTTTTPQIKSSIATKTFGKMNTSLFGISPSTPIAGLQY